MRTRNQAGKLAVALVVSLLAVAPAFAKHAQEVKLDQAVTIDGKQLNAGKYQVSWEAQGSQATVTFKHKNSLVTANCTLVDRPAKTEHDTVVFNVEDNGASSIVELRFAGTNKVLLFDTQSSSGKMAMPERNATPAGRNN